MKERSIFEDIFQLDGDRMTIASCKTGDVNSSYIVTYAGQKAFVKIQDKQNLPAFYRGQIEREVAGLRLCKERNIPCPSVLTYSYEQRYIVTEYLDFSLLSQAWGTLSGDQKAHIKRQVLSILQNLNGIAGDRFGSIYPSDCRYGEWGACYRRLIEIAVGDCLTYQSLSKKEASAVLEAADKNSLSLREGHACFNHMDLHWNNIFVEKRDELYEIVGIVDFGSALYAPAYMDLFRLNGGFFYGTEKFYSSEERPYRIDGHQSFCADVINTIDYFVFLSFIGNVDQNVKSRLLNICEDYVSKGER